MKAGIVIDKWKFSIFDRHLRQAGYSFTNAGQLADGSQVLIVVTDNPTALGVVVQAANDEANMTGNVTG